MNMLQGCMVQYTSRVAQRKRAGPITQRSMDRNHPLLVSAFSELLENALKINVKTVSVISSVCQSNHVIIVSSFHDSVHCLVMLWKCWIKRAGAEAQIFLCFLLLVIQKALFVRNWGHVVKVTNWKSGPCLRRFFATTRVLIFGVNK